MKLTALARLTIAFALENDATIGDESANECTPSQQALVKALGNHIPDQYRRPLFLAAVRDAFLAWFADAGQERAGEWLWGKPVAIAAPVVSLLVIPLSHKAGILAGFDADTDFEHTFRSKGASLRCSAIPPESVDALNLAGDILRNFYGDILAVGGVPADVLGEPEPLTRQSVLRDHVHANGQLKACPGCDGSPPPITGEHVHTDVDHFFPKSTYPFLSVHPLNLTPFCKECNQTFKGFKDPLDTSYCAQYGLDGIYHPYLRPGQDEVRPYVDRDPADGQLRLSLRSSATDSAAAARVRSLNHLLALEARWRGLLDQDCLDVDVKDAVFMLLQGSLHDGQFTTGQPDDKWFAGRLSLMLVQMRSRVGRKTQAVPTLAYAEWYTRDRSAGVAELKTIFKDLQRQRGAGAPWGTVARARSYIPID